MAKQKNQPESLGFEEAINELESIVLSIEGDQLVLEELLGRFERGTFLHKHCRNLLEQVQQRVESLSNPATDSFAVDSTPAPATPSASDTPDDSLLF